MTVIINIPSRKLFTEKPNLHAIEGNGF